MQDCADPPCKTGSVHHAKQIQQHLQGYDQHRSRQQQHHHHHTKHCLKSTQSLSMSMAEVEGHLQNNSPPPQHFSSWGTAVVIGPDGNGRKEQGALSFRHNRKATGLAYQKFPLFEADPVQKAHLSRKLLALLKVRYRSQEEACWRFI